MNILSYYWTYLILVPGIIFAAYAQYQVNSVYKKYSKVVPRNGANGETAARQLLNAYGLTSVNIETTSGNLTDHYDPKRKVLRLSSGVSNYSSVAAVGIAAHETGHAIQDEEGYWPLKFRVFVVPITNIATNLAWPVFLVGLFFGAASRGGAMMMNIGIVLFSFALLFSLITLPVEINASRRAVHALMETNLIDPSEEAGVKKVLRAAALTYVAAALMAFLTLLRLLALRGSRN